MHSAPLGLIRAVRHGEDDWSRVQKLEAVNPSDPAGVSATKSYTAVSRQ
jgi:hypothetical protein